MRAAIEETGAAASALTAYLTTVLPEARGELRRWGPLPEEKAKNAEAVAVFATLAPRSRRAAVARAIVALQVAIDLRDAAEEAGGAGDTTLLDRLDEGWRGAVATLPGYPAVSTLLERAVERCEEGQRRTHAAASGNVEGLRDWARALEAPSGYRWWEVAAGASSSAAAHALIAAAADPGATAEAAALVDAAYQPPMGALTVLLDDLVDRDRDRAGGEHNYLDYYEGPSEAAERLSFIAAQARQALAERLPRSRRHRAILAGVAAFYLSAPEAQGTYARTVQARLSRAVGPGARLLTAFMRGRRVAQRKRPG